MKSERQVLLSEPIEVLFGRLDAAHGIFPEVDLTAEGGLENGVSRRHARLYTEDGMVYIEDLDSTNGTFLDNERLTPYVPQRLEDGDVLMLGTMKICVHINREQEA
jgi:pSer/pThr/pTyr-binding forkhead associated (FHA) protein